MTQPTATATDAQAARDVWCVIWRSGGTVNYAWQRSIGMTQAEAYEGAAEVIRGGRKAFAAPWSAELPTDFDGLQAGAPAPAPAPERHRVSVLGSATADDATRRIAINVLLRKQDGMVYTGAFDNLPGTIAATFDDRFSAAEAAQTITHETGLQCRIEQW